MQTICRTIILLALLIPLAACEARALTPTPSPSPTLTQLPTSTFTPKPTSPPTAQPTPTAIPVDRHNPESVLRAYFNAWARSDLRFQVSLMDEKYAVMVPEPVDSIRILEIRSISAGSTERTFYVIFEIKVPGQGGSMQSGRVEWSYYLSWDEYRDSWLITNYGSG